MAMGAFFKYPATRRHFADLLWLAELLKIFCGREGLLGLGVLLEVCYVWKTFYRCFKAKRASMTRRVFGGLL